MADIYIIGTGIYSSLHLTREATQAAASCKKLFVLHEDPDILKALGKHCPEVIDLFEFYEVCSIDQKRADIYQRISEAVLEEASRSSGPVGLAVHGNPMFLVSAVENIVADARRRDLSVSLIAGISSFDTIQCDLGLDLGYGVQVLDCTTLVNLGLKLEPRLPCLIFQLATFKNANVVKHAVENTTLRPLVDYLKQFYPENHLCSIVISSTSTLERAQITPVELGHISSSEDFSLEHRPTLYIPAVST